MNKLIKSFVLALSLISAAASFALPTPLSFHLWKGQQVVDAQNQVTRLTNEIRLLKLNTAKLPEGEMKSKVAMQETNLNSAKENLRFAQGLEMEHYVAVHLSQFKNDPNALKEAAKAMGPDELAQLIRVLLLDNAAANAASDPAAPSTPSTTTK